MDSLITEGFNRTFVEYDLSDMPGYRQKARINAILAANAYPLDSGDRY
jgi:hypothetical protein